MLSQGKPLLSPERISHSRAFIPVVVLLWVDYHVYVLNAEAVKSAKSGPVVVGIGWVFEYYKYVCFRVDISILIMGGASGIIGCDRRRSELFNAPPHM